PISLDDGLLDQLAHHAAATGRASPVGAAVAAVVARPAIARVERRHRAAAAAAADDALQQRAALAGRARAVTGAVGREPLLVAQELLPADVARVVVVDQ